jgi:hypothetical protein
MVNSWPGCIFGQDIAPAGTENIIKDPMIRFWAARRRWRREQTERTQNKRQQVARAFQALDVMERDPAGVMKRQEIKDHYKVSDRYIAHIYGFVNLHRCECCGRINLPAEFTVPPVKAGVNSVRAEMGLPLHGEKGTGRSALSNDDG